MDALVKTWMNTSRKSIRDDKVTQQTLSARTISCYAKSLCALPHIRKN